MASGSNLTNFSHGRKVAVALSPSHYSVPGGVGVALIGLHETPEQRAGQVRNTQVALGLSQAACCYLACL